MIIIVFFTTTLNEFLSIMFYWEVQVLKYACRTVQAERSWSWCQLKIPQEGHRDLKKIKCTCEYQYSKEYFPM